MERLFRIFRSNAVQESAADDTDGVDDQARLMSVEGTMWYMVRSAVRLLCPSPRFRCRNSLPALSVYASARIVRVASNTSSKYLCSSCC